MKHKPNITFINGIEDVLKSKEIVEEFVPFLKRNGYEYYYPFTENVGTEEVVRQIERDMDEFELKVSSEKFQTVWNSFDKGTTERDSIYAKDYICVVTMYGPRGFFYTPNTIYVNVTFDSERDWVQTMLHEMLHLAHFEETKELAHAEREGFIDKKFIELWGDTFPEYSKQKISR